MEPELEPGFDLNYPVPLSKELPGFSGSGSEPGSITITVCLMISMNKQFPEIIITHLHYSSKFDKLK